MLEWCWSSLGHIGVCWKLELNGGCWSGLEWFGMAWSSVGVRVGSTHAPLFVPICIFAHSLPHIIKYTLLWLICQCEA